MNISRFRKPLDAMDSDRLARDGLGPACALRTHVPVIFYVRERLLLRESPRRSGYQHTSPLNDDTIDEKGSFEIQFLGLENKD